MKKLLAVILSLVCACTLAACDIKDLPMEEIKDLVSALEEMQSSAAESDDASKEESTFDTSSESDLYAQWASLVGYWHAADGRYFLLDMADSHTAYFEEGTWDTSHQRGGYVEDLTLAGSVYQGTARYPEVAATEMEEQKPEESVAIQVDVSGLDNDGKINITVNGERYTCAFAGQTREEAYAVHQQNMGDIVDANDPLAVLWRDLQGCWEADGTHFAEFSFRDGEPVFYSGEWGNPLPAGREAGHVSDYVKAEAGHYYTVTVFYPPLKEPADAQDLLSYRYTLMIGVTELEKGNLELQIPEDSTLRSYRRAADSYIEAMQTKEK